MSDTDAAYLGIEPCGCATFVMVAGTESAREERAELKRVIRSGRRVEVVTVAEARKRWTHCEHSTRPLTEAGAVAEAAALVRAARDR